MNAVVVTRLLMVAVTRYHRLGASDSRHLFPSTSGGWKFKIQALAGLVSCRTVGKGSVPGLSPWLVDGLLPVSYHGVSSVCVCVCPPFLLL